ncbi:MAG: hypothetical protein WCC32_19340 [Terriglobales bacterium]
MLKRRYLVAAFCLTGLCIAAAQEKTAETDLSLKIIGNGKTISGVPTGFRVYEAPDGAKGQVSDVKFKLEQDAQLQIEEWVSATPSVISRDRDQIKGRIRISDRIVGVANLTKSDKKEFVIIRRDDLNCYLIESESLQVAAKIEDLIRHD